MKSSVYYYGNTAMFQYVEDTIPKAIPVDNPVAKRIKELEAALERVRALHVYEGGDMMRGISGDWVSIDDIKAAIKGVQ